MSSLGKVFLIVTVIAALAAGVLAFLIVGQKNDLKQNLDSTTSTLDTTKKDLDKTKKDLSSSETSLKDTASQLSEAKSKSEALQASLTQAETKSTELGKNLKDAIENVKVAEAKVEEVNKALGGKDPVVLKAEALKAQEDLTTLQREKKIIDDQLAAVNAEVARLKDIKERSLTGKLLPGINGRVLTVNKAWSFVVLNVGLKAGVVENGVLMVYRGEKLLGKVKVVSAEENSSVADIIPEWSKGEIQAGDDVFN